MPTVRFSVGVTGHRRSHASYPADDTSLRASLTALFARIDTLASEGGAHEAPRLVTLLADGADQASAELALARDWELVAPLPFGAALNRAIAAMPLSAADAALVLAEQPARDNTVNAQLAPIMALESRARLFQIAERDAVIADLLLRHLADPADSVTANSFLFESAQRFALGARVMIEQCDLVVAVWDGKSHANTGGTGDTVRAALLAAVPVLWLDPAKPDDWRVLTSSEQLAAVAAQVDGSDPAAHLASIVEDAIGEQGGTRFAKLAQEAWPGQSAISSHAYRRIEALFGANGLRERFASIRQTYPLPARYAEGEGQAMLGALRGLADEGSSMADRIVTGVMARFAWTDGIATHLSDRHRSAMIVNFLLGSIAIVAGVLYLPLGGSPYKWVFASVELAVLLAIVANTARARRESLHERWFATRRAAEYLRHRPLMLAVGVARPVGQWPHGEHSGWPELFARQSAREAGLPRARIDAAWLRRVLRALSELHVVPQRDYHRDKSRRLERVHHALDQLSEWLFAAAIVSVTIYLALAAASAEGLLPSLDLEKVGKWLTVAGVAFPTIGGALAGIRYFGDFERFADISQVTAQRLDEITQRIAMLEQVPDASLAYADIADLLRATDAVVMAELESWQAVFSGKKVAVPV